MLRDGLIALILVKGTLIYSTRRMTLEEMNAAFSLSKRTMARFHDTMLRGSYDAFSTKTWLFAFICFTFACSIADATFLNFVGFDVSVG